MEDQPSFKILTQADISVICLLCHQLNPKLSIDEIKDYIMQMFAFDTYCCFGVLLNNKLVGLASAWTTVKLYSGKQLEVDNVIIDSSLQSKGIGKLFFGFIDNWAKENQYKTIELNTYVQNARSHKFYFNLGYSILGFHFWKHI